MTQAEKNARQDRVRNLEFKKQFSLTNIGYLLGEAKPFSETTERNLAFNRAAVQQCDAELAELNNVK